MADLPNNPSKMNDIETAQGAPVSEATVQKEGSNINYLIEKGPNSAVITSSSSWVAPANVHKITLLAIAPGGGGGEGGGPINFSFADNNGSNGANGGAGGNITFDGVTVAFGGEGGLGGGYFRSTGMGILNLSENVGQGEKGILLNGVEYGRGGNSGGGAAKTATNAGNVTIVGRKGNPGGRGGIGYRTFNVIPGNSYPIVIGGVGGAGEGNSLGGGGAAGGPGAVLISWDT